MVGDWPSGLQLGIRFIVWQLVWSILSKIDYTKCTISGKTLGSSRWHLHCCLILKPLLKDFSFYLMCEGAQSGPTANVCPRNSWKVRGWVMLKQKWFVRCVVWPRRKSDTLKCGVKSHREGEMWYHFNMGISAHILRWSLLGDINSVALCCTHGKR